MNVFLSGLTELKPRLLSAAFAPTFAALRSRAAELGALGVTLSGACPSVLVWCSLDAMEQVAAGVRDIAPTAAVHAVRPENAGLRAS